MRAFIALVGMKPSATSWRSWGEVSLGDPIGSLGC